MPYSLKGSEFKYQGKRSCDHLQNILVLSYNVYYVHTLTVGQELLKLYCRSNELCPNAKVILCYVCVCVCVCVLCFTRYGVKGIVYLKDKSGLVAQLSSDNNTSTIIFSTGQS